jgi:cell wall-associated NlpC family hydrolase
LISGVSCNLFRYGIEERKKEKANNVEANSEKENHQGKHEKKSERAVKAESILREAKKFDGVPYKLGGDNKKGIDCSALVMLSHKSMGITLPRTSFEQSKVGVNVNLKDAQPGDLIFFKFKKSSTNNPVNHVGIVSKIDVSGNLYFYHASTSLGVTESSLTESYYRDVFVKIMRVY